MKLVALSSASWLTILSEAGGVKWIGAKFIIGEQKGQQRMLALASDEANVQIFFYIFLTFY
jgi:hypothetical protein